MHAVNLSLLTTGNLAPAAVAPLAFLGGLGMILVALGFAAYVVQRQLGWGALGLGALAWAVTVALKFAWAVPFNPPVYSALNQALPSLGVPLFALYVGALTGLFEVGLVALLLYRTRIGKAGWRRAVAFGIGFGAVEALLLGLLSLSSMVGAFLIAGPQPPGSLGALAHLNTLSWALAPVVERLAAIVIHTCSNVLIFYAVNTGQARWFWLALGYKTAVDGAAAACVQINGIDTLHCVWTLEALLILFGLAGWLGLRWLAPRYQALPIAEEAARRARLAPGTI